MNYPETIKRVIFSPKDFFKELPLTGGYGEPLKFAVINLSIASILGLAINTILGEMSPNIPALTIGIIRSIIGGIIGLFISTAILHILLKIFGAKKGYEATFRVGAYLTAFGLLSWIPYIVFIIVLYVLYLEVVIFTSVHEISTFRSFLAVFMIPLILVITILAAGSSYLWVSSLQSSVNSQMQKDKQTNIISRMNTTQNTRGQVFWGSNAQISILSVSENLRNNKMNILLTPAGQNKYLDKNLTVYIDGALVDPPPKCEDVEISEDCTATNLGVPSKCEDVMPKQCVITLNETPFPSKGESVTIKIMTADGTGVEYKCIGTGKRMC